MQLAAARMSKLDALLVAIQWAEQVEPYPRLVRVMQRLAARDEAYAAGRMAATRH